MNPIPKTCRRSIRTSLAMIIVCAAVGAATGPGFAQTAAPTVAPALASGDWTAEGEGKVGAGSFVSTGKKPLIVSNATLKEKMFVISGEVVLKTSAALRINFNDEPAAAKKPDARSGAALAMAGVTIDLDKDGSTFRSGTQKWTSAVASGDSHATEFMVFVSKSAVVFCAGPLTEIRRRDPGQAVDLSFVLGNGAELRGLKTTLVAGDKAGSMFPLVDASREANVVVAGNSAVVGRLLEAPRGTQLIDDVPFVFPGGELQAMDVAASLSGVKDPFKNKNNFYYENTTNANGRVVLAAPGDQYGALHLIAFSAGRADHVQRMTVRVGLYGAAVAMLEDVVVEVPALNADVKPGGDIVASQEVKLADGKTGRLYHIRVPMAKTANIKEFGRYSIEFTRDMNTHVLPPDPNEFGTIPAGAASDVVVLAATLEPSPVTMTYVTQEAGNVFYDTQKAVFKTTLTNRSANPQSVRAFATATGPGTGEEGIERKIVKAEAKESLQPGESKEVSLDVTPGMRGWFECVVGMEAGGRVVQQRDTTMAVLAPDTRKAREDSPFGIWNFWVAHNLIRGADTFDAQASLMKKGGWRWTYGGVPASSATDAKENMLRLHNNYFLNFSLHSAPESYQRGSGWFDQEKFAAVADDVKSALAVYDSHFKVMHESRSSSDLLRRFSRYLGGEPYEMPAPEKAQLEEQFENVKKYCTALKAVDPRVKVVLFNDYPGVADQFLARGFPKQAFDAIGLEGAMFMRSPERQPDWMSLLGNLQQMKRSQAKHGYDKPVWTTEALYHGTEAGNLSLHQQGAIAVREAMLALQLGVERMAAAGCIKDPSDDYHWSNWGSTGYCFRDPELNPKPSYAMYAWLTQVLDQAKAAGKIATPNTSLHVVGFKKADGSYVYSVWTANGVQNVTLKITGAATVFDAYGNGAPAPGESVSVIASDTPQYITGAMIQAVVSASPAMLAGDKAIESPLIDFDKPDAFKTLAEKNAVLDNSWATPLIKGEFEASFVKDDGASVMKISLKADSDARKLFPRYVQYQLAAPITLVDRPYQFALRVKGNSGWGQIVFEVVDAKGRIWTSSGNQYQGSANAADPLGESFVNFEGWHTMTIPIVGMYPGKDQAMYWPKNYNWWPSNTPEEGEAAAKIAEAEAKYPDALKAYDEAMKKYDADHAEWNAAVSAAKSGKKGVPREPKAPTKPAKPSWRNMGLCPVDYPLKLTKIIVLMRPNILYVDDERPVANPTIELDALGVTAPPPRM